MWKEKKSKRAFCVEKDVEKWIKLCAVQQERETVVVVVDDEVQKEKRKTKQKLSLEQERKKERIVWCDHNSERTATRPIAI